MKPFKWGMFNYLYLKTTHLLYNDKNESHLSINNNIVPLKKVNHGKKLKKSFF